MESVRKRYGRGPAALNGVDLSIARGERVALLGANGAGKSTLLRCVAGLTAFEGRLMIGGVRAGPAGVAARALTAYAPQGSPVFDLRLRSFVELIAAVRGIDETGPAACLTALGLPLAEHGDTPMLALSGGMVQKAHLALALGSGAPVVLLDEPAAGLDRSSRDALARLIASLEPSRTIVLATHRVEEIETMTERVVILDAGRVVFDGRMDDVGHVIPYRSRSASGDVTPCAATDLR